MLLQVGLMGLSGSPKTVPTRSVRLGASVDAPALWALPDVILRALRVPSGLIRNPDELLSLRPTQA